MDGNLDKKITLKTLHVLEKVYITNFLKKHTLSETLILVQMCRKKVIKHSLQREYLTSKMNTHRLR